jgi:hypothetical protein
MNTNPNLSIRLDALLDFRHEFHWVATPQLGIHGDCLDNFIQQRGSPVPTFPVRKDEPDCMIDKL